VNEHERKSVQLVAKWLSALDAARRALAASESGEVER
jgi:hypothetical protein